MVNYKKILLAFVIGSSAISTLVSNLYIGIANSKKNIVKHYEFFPLGLAVLFGFYNILNYLLYNQIHSDLSAIVSGILFGITLSSIGRFGMDLPYRLFDFTRNNEYMIHVYASILYAGVFYFIIQNLNKMFLF